MNLALSVRVAVDPEILLRDPWAHEMTHALAAHLRRARQAKLPRPRVCRSR